MGLSCWQRDPKATTAQRQFEGDTKGWGVVGWVSLGLAVEIRTPSRGKWQPSYASS